MAEGTVGIVGKAHHVRSTYLKAISSAQKQNRYPEVLLACAMATTDELGFFNTADICEPLSLILGRKCEVQHFNRHLKEFCKEIRGPVLISIGVERRIRYRFINALMQPFVILEGLAKGMLPVDMILDEVETQQVNHAIH